MQSEENDRVQCGLIQSSIFLYSSNIVLDTKKDLMQQYISEPVFVGDFVWRSHNIHQTIV